MNPQVTRLSPDCGEASQGSGLSCHQRGATPHAPKCRVVIRPAAYVLPAAGGKHRRGRYLHSFLWSSFAGVGIPLYPLCKPTPDFPLPPTGLGVSLSSPSACTTQASRGPPHQRQGVYKHPAGSRPDTPYVVCNGLHTGLQIYITLNPLRRNAYSLCPTTYNNYFVELRLSLPNETCIFIPPTLSGSGRSEYPP